MVKTGVGHALYKAGYLNVDHAAAVVAHVLFKLGQMRQLAISARKLGFADLLAPVKLGVAVFILASAVFSALAAEIFEVLNVDLGNNEAVLALVGGKHLAVFGDHAQAGVYVVGRALTLAGRGENNAAFEVLGAVFDRFGSLDGRGDGGREGCKRGDNGRTGQSVARSRSVYGVRVGTQPYRD